MLSSDNLSLRSEKARLGATVGDGRRRLSPFERRGQILEAAEGLFIERGFEAVRMGDIAVELGIARPSVYKYFPSTNSILKKLFDDHLERLWSRLEPIIGARSAGDESATIAQIFEVLLGEGRLLLLMRSGGGPDFQHRLHDLLDKRFTKHLDPYITEGRDPYTVRILITLLEGVAFWAIYEGLEDTGPLQRSITSFVGRGLDQGD
jgi:AcrR family transcriptional regulator